MTHKQEMIEATKRLVSGMTSFGVEMGEISVSENLYGVSCYVNGGGHYFRVSDHQCQRGQDTYTFLSKQSIDLFLLDYEKIRFPERFNWKYHDKFIMKPDGTEVQVKTFLGRK